MGKVPMMIRFLVFCLVSACLGVCYAGQPPNIILCMGDDHGWEETGYNGHPHLKTPVLDEMASSGLRLDRFYAASPVCTPTRTASGWSRISGARSCTRALSCGILAMIPSAALAPRTGSPWSLRISG